jgi:hypothetical protein
MVRGHVGCIEVLNLVLVNQILVSSVLVRSVNRPFVNSGQPHCLCRYLS